MASTRNVIMTWLKRANLVVDWMCKGIGWVLGVVIAISIVLFAFKIVASF